MKHFIYLAASLLCLSSCEQEDSNTPIVNADFNQAVTLRYQQHAALPEQNAPELIVTVEDINDSRCPADVTCVWAGRAQIKLGLRDQSGTSQTLNLQIAGGPERLDSVAVQANGRQYSVVLRDVTPYPGRNDVPMQDKRVVLTVKRQ